MIRKLMIAVMTAPKSITVFLLSAMICQASPFTFLPPNTAISGLIRLFVTLVTTPVNAAPMTTATARSMTLPRMMKFLNPWIMAALPGLSASLPRGTLGPGQRDCHRQRARAGGSGEPVCVGRSDGEHGDTPEPGVGGRRCGGEQAAAGAPVAAPRAARLREDEHHRVRREDDGVRVALRRHR